jgi:hypothetical protein
LEWNVRSPPPLRLWAILEWDDFEAGMRRFVEVIQSNKWGYGNKPVDLKVVYKRGHQCFAMQLRAYYCDEALHANYYVITDIRIQFGCQY